MSEKDVSDFSTYIVGIWFNIIASADTPNNTDFWFTLSASEVIANKVAHLNDTLKKTWGFF